MVRGKKALENQRYGEFIKQTNEVQYMLAYVVLIRSAFIDKKYKDFLIERAELGILIHLFRACIRPTPSTYKLFLRLQKYKKDRDTLAHKMFSVDKLTPQQCNYAIIQGKNILTKLYDLGKIPNKLRSRF